MKERISTLMDGELYEDEATALLGNLKSDAEAQQDWRAYHLIGDVLRQPDHISRDITPALRVRLREEPAVLAPRVRINKKIGYIAMSAAASVSALAVVVWMAMQIQTEPSGLALQQVPPASLGNAQVAGAMSGKLAAAQGKAINKDMDDYLVAHQEVSPSTEMAGGTTYIHTVAAR
ncbi:MAG TPA: sigma-E factor negative regulatory protein [Gallionellaceae bacterium]|nr:sigma-E factor negative regulatory protein [Gallionellaceae bacterium]